MRIPSGLNDGSLYRHRPEKRPETSSNRRLIRLCVALALVLVVMKQAGKPQAYRIFFPEQATREATASSDASEFFELGSEYNDRLDSLSTLQPMSGTIESLPEDARPQLSKLLARLRNNGETAADPGDESLIQTLREASQAAGEPLDIAESASVPMDRDTQLRLQSALDDVYLRDVDDAAIWSRSDNPAFYRLLEAGGRIGLNSPLPRKVGVVALLQQPDIYLRQPVILKGTVARASRLNSKTNDFGIRQYYEMWLEPDDGSKRPVAFYSATAPVAIQRIVGVNYISDGPTIEIEGVFLKRLAFRAQSGSELAPALVGRITSLEAPMFAPTATTSANASAEVAWQWPVAMAALIGIGGAVAFMVASTISARRSRARRLASQSHVSPPFSTFAEEQDAKAFHDVSQ